MDQSVIPEDLLPITTSTPWEDILLETIKEIQSKWTSYKNPGGRAGCLEDRYFRGARIMRASSPAYSHCCGAIFELFMLSWKKWLGDWYETEKDLSVAQMKQLYRRFFLIKSLDIPDKEFGLGASVALEQLPRWLSWFSEHNVKVERVDDPVDAQFGDFCQIQNGSNPEYGHTVLVLGDGWVRGQPVLHVWSSNLGYDNSWEYTKGAKPGHCVDYYYIRKVIKGFKRKFHIARLVEPPYEE